MIRSNLRRYGSKPWLRLLAATALLGTAIGCSPSPSSDPKDATGSVDGRIDSTTDTAPPVEDGDEGGAESDVDRGMDADGPVHVDAHHEPHDPPDGSIDSGADASPRPVLAAPGGWTRVGASDDPFEDRPDAPSCESTGYAVETLQGDDAFGFFSERCDYLTVRQEARVDVDAGSTVQVRFWHFKLTAPDGGEAHVALATDDGVLWEKRISIPTKGGELYTPDVTLSNAIEKGDPLYYHVHNHGQNEYYLFDVRIGR